MDLADLLPRYQNVLARAGTVAWVASRASHRALAAGDAARIRARRLAPAMAEAA